MQEMKFKIKLEFKVIRNFCIPGRTFSSTIELRTIFIYIVSVISVMMTVCVWLLVECLINYILYNKRPNLQTACNK